MYLLKWLKEKIWNQETLFLFSGHSLSKDAKNKSHWGRHCTGSTGWDLARSSTGLSGQVAGQHGEDVLALESGNNVAVKAHALQAVVLLLFLFF